MSTNIVNKNDFTHGQLDRTFFSRADTDLYSRGAQSLKNMVVRATGGAERRFGTNFELDITQNVSPNGAVQLFTITYKSSTLDEVDGFRYLLVLSNRGTFAELEIFRILGDGLLFIKNFIETDDAVPVDLTPLFTASRLENAEIKFAQNAGFGVIVHSRFDPLKLAAIGNIETDPEDPAIWKLTTEVFTHLPAFDFNDLPKPGGYTDVDFQFSDDPSVIGATLVLNQMGGTPPSVFNEPITTRIGTTTSWGDLLKNGTLVATGNLDATNPVVQLGLARITGKVSGTAINVTIVSPFDADLQTNTFKGKEAFLGEPAFSFDRGWPQSISFFENRQIMGGAFSNPQTVFMSVTEDFENFDTGQGDPTDAVIESLGDGGVDHILNVVSTRTLQIFTTEGEYTVPQLVSDGITPSNVSFRKQTDNGSEDIQPIALDNQTLYIKKGGKVVMSSIYTDTSDSYTSTNISIVSSELIKMPISIDKLKSSDERQEDYLIVINADGTLALWQTVADQNINAWTPGDTQGEFYRVVASEEDVYFVVKRTINTVPKFYIEKLNFNVRTDSTFLSPSGFNNNVTIIPELAGETVQIRGNPNAELFGDGNVGVFPEDEADPFGVIELSITLRSYEIGLGFDVELIDMPVHFSSFESGDNLYKRKRLSRI